MEKEKEEVIAVEEEEEENEGEGDDNPKRRWSFSEPWLREIINRKYRQLMPTLFHYVDYYAKTKPKEIAIVEYDTKEEVTWADFAKASKAFAALLFSYGMKKGDIISTSLPFLKEHIYLMIGALRLGVVVAPLDLRLTAAEVAKNLAVIKPRIHFFLGNALPVKDFRPVFKEVMETEDKKNGGSVEHWVQFQKSTDGVVDGAVHVKTFVKSIKLTFVWNALKEVFGYGVWSVQKTITKRDPCFIIFTTGSTGVCKPALLCHEGVLVQNMCLDIAFIQPALRKSGHKNINMLVNLPPSHVGGLTEQLFTPIYGGSTSVVLHAFKPDKSLDAVQKYKVRGLGQIPALFNLQWKLENYDDYDLSSLLMGLYGGQCVSKVFLERMRDMCGGVAATGLGLTEMSGFCTYTPFDGSVEEMMQSIGYDCDVSPITVRAPMNEDGTAGDVLPKGEVGEICFSGPQVFLGYYGMEEETKKAKSTDGILYTGDMGSYDETGLHFVSRRKFVIKPKGYQVFPPEVEDFIQTSFKQDVEFIGVVGIKHEVFSQGVVAVMKLKKDSELTKEEIAQKCKEGLASYKRPSLLLFMEEDETFPLNRVAKTDYLKVTEFAQGHVNKMREEGGWDADGKKE